MARYKPGPPIGYRGPFRTMDDIYRDYRNTLMNKGPYRAYFTSTSSYGETSQKFRKQSLPEHRPVSEGRTEQPNENNAAQNVEIKNETTKTETPQKIETSQKETTEKQNEVSTNEKIGLPEYQQDKIEQTDIRTRNRPSPYYDRAETRW